MATDENGNTLGSQGEAERILVDAEDALQRGLVDEASSLAKTVLQLKTAGTTADKARAINVLIQADFHFHDKLTDLNALLTEAGLALEQLPVTAVLLWGVVAVELEAAESARSLLKQYLDAKDFGEGSGATREDCLALSRLYAVQLLSGLCGDFQAAADWLTGGGAGLSEEQQELLLLEVDEAEELAQEEHVAVWTTQDAAQAAQLGGHAHHSNGAAAGDGGSYSDLLDVPGQDCGGTDVGSIVGSMASTAVAALHELGPSVSGVLSSQSLHPAAEASHEMEEESTVSPEALQQQPDAAPSSAADSSSGAGSSAGSQTTPAAAAAAAGARLEAVAAAVAAAEAQLGSLTAPLPSPAALALPPAAVAVRGLEDSERVPSSPSLASWRRSPDEVAVQDQSSQRDRGGDSNSNPFITITGAFNDQGYDAAVVAELAAAAAAAGGSGSSPAASPDKGSKGIRHSNSSSSVKSRLRDAASNVAAAAVATVTAAVVRGEAAAAGLLAGSSAAAAAAGSKAEQQANEGAPDAEQEEQQQSQPHQQPQQQQQNADSLQSRLSSYASWATDKASSAWSSQPVQDALRAFNLQDVPPWELAGGAAAAALLTYSLYRNRRRVRRAAADFAAGVASTAQMALGVSVNPMAAVPGTGHMMR